MHQARNIVFALLVVAFLIGPAALTAVRHLDSALIPDWLDSEDVAFLAGGKAKPTSKNT